MFYFGCLSTYFNTSSFSFSDNVFLKLVASFSCKCDIVKQHGKPSGGRCRLLHRQFICLWSPCLSVKMDGFCWSMFSYKKGARNPHDKFAVGVICKGDVTGHLPHSIAKNVSYFLSYHRNVGFCEITGEKCNRGGGLKLE